MISLPKRVTAMLGMLCLNSMTNSAFTPAA